jgi:hypothetical protein
LKRKANWDFFNGFRGLSLRRYLGFGHSPKIDALAQIAEWRIWPKSGPYRQDAATQNPVSIKALPIHLNYKSFSGVLADFRKMISGVTGGLPKCFGSKQGGGE